MHTRNFLVSLLLLQILTAAGAARAEQTTPTTPTAPAPAPAAAAGSEPAAQPEYRTRALPTDTFKPSEQVSEDYAVPFPADI